MSWRTHPIITQVLPYMYLGGSSYTLEDLKQRNIRHVLTVCYDPKELELDEGHPLNILHLAVDDFPDDNIKYHFDKAFQFIENAIAKKESVLIHCHAGMSRSPTITIAYILHKAKNQPQHLVGIVCSDENSDLKLLSHQQQEQDSSDNSFSSSSSSTSSSLSTNVQASLASQADNDPSIHQHFTNMVKEPTLKNVFGFVKTKRCIIEPNNGFMKQLLTFEKELLGAISADPVLFDDDIWGEGCKKLYDQYLESLYPSDNNVNNCEGDESSTSCQQTQQPQQNSLGNQ